MRILIATDSFPPACGGSGWSTYELARGLRARGHTLTIVQPRPGAPSLTRTFEGIEIRQVGAATTRVPFLRNYLKHERLTSRLTRLLTGMARETGAEVIHAQHVLTAPASAAAAAAASVASVCTVRDYWPVCYWSDLIHDPAAGALCPACTPGAMTRCIRPRAGRLWPLAVPLIPYMRATLERKRAALAAFDAIVAVSSTIAADLRRRAPEAAATRLEVIPNPLDLEVIQAAAARPAPPIGGPYAIYAGKLAPNKGAAKLIPAVAHARLPWPLVVVGDGPDRGAVESAARLAGRDVRVLGWLPRDEALAWVAHASLLVFPSHGPESLSRVLLESAALGVPIAAMDTGGTRDIVIDGETGLLTGTTAEALGAAVARLVTDRSLAARLGHAAQDHVARHFASTSVVARLERLYEELAARHGATSATGPHDRGPR